MRGLSCGACSHANKPYVTAYEIALKHGFKGTEEEWINTIGCIYLAKVTEQAGGDWACSDSYADLVAISEYKELHLVTLDGKIAFLNGIDESKITFCTTSYEADEGTVYDKYELPVNGEGDYDQVDVSNETGTITIDRLASGIQTSLGKADTAYQKPANGIPYNHLETDLVEDINRATMIVVSLVKDGGNIVVDRDHTDMHGYNSIIEAVADGADVRAQYSPSQIGSPWVLHPFIGTANSGNLMVFGGPEMWTDGDSYTTMICYYGVASDDSVDYVARSLT